MNNVPIRYRTTPPEWDDWNGETDKTVTLQARYAASPPTRRFNGTFILQIWERASTTKP